MKDIKLPTVTKKANSSDDFATNVTIQNSSNTPLRTVKPPSITGKTNDDPSQNVPKSPTVSISTKKSSALVDDARPKKGGTSSKIQSEEKNTAEFQNDQASVADNNNDTNHLNIITDLQNPDTNSSHQVSSSDDQQQDAIQPKTNAQQNTSTQQQTNPQATPQQQIDQQPVSNHQQTATQKAPNQQVHNQQVNNQQNQSQQQRSSGAQMQQGTVGNMGLGGFGGGLGGGLGAGFGGGNTGGFRNDLGGGGFGSNSIGADPWADPWSDPWSADPRGGQQNWGNPNANQPPKQLTPAERVEMIEKVYQDVLNRKPDTRDINYYKYSTLGENEIIAQLLVGKEHVQLLQDGKDYKKMKDRAEQAETRVKMLEGQIKDQLEEFSSLADLLEEKNRLIQQLRRDQNNPYSFQSPKSSIPQFIENHDTGKKLDVESTTNDQYESLPTDDSNTTTLDPDNQSGSDPVGLHTEKEVDTSSVAGFSVPMFSDSIGSSAIKKRTKSLKDKIIELFSVQ